MNFNWDDALSEIFGSGLVCPRCEQGQLLLVAGYSKKPELNRYAARHECDAGDDCDARKLITLCVECARAERLRGEPQDGPQLLETYMLDCRNDLEESLEFLAGDWRDEPDLTDTQFDTDSLEQAIPDVFVSERQHQFRLEEEYLRYYREFRARGLRIPDPGWRSTYVEAVRELGYDTFLGD